MNRESGRKMDMPSCPSCKAPPDRVRTSVRQGQMDMADLYPHLDMKRGTVTGVSDVGWRCMSCEQEWGYEKLSDEYLAMVELLTGGRTPEHQGQAVKTLVKFAGLGYLVVRIKLDKGQWWSFTTRQLSEVATDGES